MRIPEKDLRTVNWEKVEAKRIDEGLSRRELSELLGKAPTYITNAVTRNARVHKDIEKALNEMLELDKPGNGDEVMVHLIARIGELEGKIAQLEKKMEEPAIVAIPMEAKEMATRVLGELLEGGWCTKDDVLREFNRHHIPMQYINDAIHANGVTLATSGVADRVRTFYIKEE